MLTLQTAKDYLTKFAPLTTESPVVAEWVERMAEEVANLAEYAAPVVLHIFYRDSVGRVRPGAIGVRAIAGEQIREITTWVQPKDDRTVSAASVAYRARPLPVGHSHEGAQSARIAAALMLRHPSIVGVIDEVNP